MVVRGSGRMKLDEEIVDLKVWDVVRVPPGTWRGYEAGPEGLELLVIGAPNLGENPRDDVEGQRDWWADSTPRRAYLDSGPTGSRMPCRLRRSGRPRLWESPVNTR